MDGSATTEEPSSMRGLHGPLVRHQRSPRADLGRDSSDFAQRGPSVSREGETLRKSGKRCRLAGTPPFAGISGFALTQRTEGILAFSLACRAGGRTSSRLSFLKTSSESTGGLKPEATARQDKVELCGLACKAKLSHGRRRTKAWIHGTQNRADTNVWNSSTFTQFSTPCVSQPPSRWSDAQSWLCTIVTFCVHSALECQTILPRGVSDLVRPRQPTTLLIRARRSSHPFVIGTMFRSARRTSPLQR